MRKFHNFLEIFLFFLLFFNSIFMIKNTINFQEKANTINIEQKPYIGTSVNSWLDKKVGKIEFTTIPETTTQVEEVTTQTENPLTSAPTVQKTTIQSSSQYEEDENGKYYWFNASCTAYCACKKCCGDYGVNRPLDENGEPIISTASGNRAVPKYTIAMSKSFKFGTKVYIEGIGMCEVMDRGGAVKGNVIDIYFGSHEEALNWGRRSIKVKIYI